MPPSQGNDARHVPRIAAHEDDISRLHGDVGSGSGVLAHWGIVLHPAVGAILMSASTVVVAINAQLLRRVAL